MAGCCWSPPYVKLQSTAISLFIFCLIAISLSITNFLLQNNRNDCGYCYWEYGYGKNSTNRVGVKMDHEPSDRYLESIGPETRTMWYETTTTTPPPTTTGSTTEAADTELSTNWWDTTTPYWKSTTRGYYWYCEGRWMYEYDYYNCRDSCDGGYYYMEGIAGTFFAFLASIIAWCGSCKRQSEPFSILYRVQATFAVLGMLTTMGALGWDIYLMVEYGYELNRYCTDIFGIWLAEIVIVFIVLINTMVSSGRLGCCCVVGCPS